MAITEAYTGSVSVSTTELSLVTGTSTLQAINIAGVYQLLLDLSTMVAGDSFRLRIKEKVQIGGTQRAVQDVVIDGLQSEPVYVTASVALINGFDFTLVRVGGADRIIAWSIRKAA